MNRNIRRLYERNYTTPTTDPMRKWSSPFYLPSEQALLKSILAKKQNRPTASFIIPTRFDAGDDDDGGSVMSSSSLGSLSDDGSSIMTDVSSSEGEEKEEEVEDPSISKESDYYQNEVYKERDNRRPYPNDEIDKELSDRRHLIAVDNSDRTVYVAHRGTADLLDAIIDLTAISRSGTGRLKDRVDFNNIQFLAKPEKMEMSYHIDLMKKIIKKYPDYKFELSGHSKGGLNAQMILAFLENKIPGLPYKGKKLNKKVYTYNSAPYEWEGESSHPDMYPRRTEYDPISAPFGRFHPNLKTIRYTTEGREIGFRNAHDSNNFLNIDFSKIKSRGEL